MENSSLFPEFLDKSDKFPVVKITDFVHLVENGFCVAAIVSGIPENYNERGELIVHMMLPVPQTPALCAPGMPVYKGLPFHSNSTPASDVEKTDKTWHLPNECFCPKKIPNASPNRILIPSSRIQ
jgi:hypothetical protein